MDLRDRHMNEKYIKAKKFPKMIFTLRNATVSTQPGAASKLVGSLQFRGVEKKFEVVAVIKSQSTTQIVVTSSFDLNITDFKIPQPKFMGLKMHTDLQLELYLVLRKK
jgi:polyisoprenoid-binding protein YceI